MKGFKDFLLRGNLVELAVAFIIAKAFGDVVTAFTTVVMNLIALIVGKPNFDSLAPYGIGAFITALVSFVILAAVVYFGIVLPYNKLKTLFEKQAEEEAAGPETNELLTEIRDLLKK